LPTVPAATEPPHSRGIQKSQSGAGAPVCVGALPLPTPVPIIDRHSTLEADGWLLVAV